MKKFERARALLSNKNGALVLRSRSRSRARRVPEGPRSGAAQAETRRTKAKGRGENEIGRTCGEKDRAIPGRAQNLWSGWWAGRRPIVPTLGRRPAPNPRPGGGRPSRRIPAAGERRRVRPGQGRCTYVGSNGERCAATHHLQIDHVIPYARGGTNALGNLRLLCERHNKKEAERVYGANVMRKFRARE